MDWDDEADWEWRTAADDSPEELMALWRARWPGRARRSRRRWPRAAWTSGWRHRPDGSSPACGGAIVDMIEEYARHVGHADLLRESMDGEVGEDPPEDFAGP